MLLGTGCRIGEICGLRWSDVDMEKRIIDINHSMTYFRRGKQALYTFEFKFEPPKTKAGIRKIPMLDDVYKVLKEMHENQKENEFSPLVVDGATGFIFINKLGNLYKHNAIDHSIRRIVNTHNAEEEIKAKKEHREPIMLPFFSCHTFRHTFCTRFCENETNVKVIQAVMGHADINTTMDIYAEVTETKKREKMEKFIKEYEDFLGKSPRKRIHILCNKKAVLQQICNEFEVDSALCYYVVHCQKCLKQVRMCNNTE